MAVLHSRNLRGQTIFYNGNPLSIERIFGSDSFGFKDDFLYPASAASDAIPGYTTTLVEAGGGESTVAQQDGSAGELLITTDANEDDGVELQKVGEAFGCASTNYLTYFGIRLKCDEATQNDFLVGLCITDTTLLGGMTDGIYFEKLDGGTGISFVTEKNSTETQTDSLATFAANTYVTLEFLFDGASVRALINGVVVATHTTNICNDELLTPSIHYLAGEALAKTMTVDWIAAWQIGR